MISPTPGRVVWYRPNGKDGIQHDPKQPLAAIVAHVWSDTDVNLSVSDIHGNVHARTHVALVQGETVPSDVPYCEWMPYQKGQAAKTKQLEQQQAAEAAAPADGAA